MVHSSGNGTVSPAEAPTVLYSDPANPLFIIFVFLTLGLWALFAIAVLFLKRDHYQWQKRMDDIRQDKLKAQESVRDRTVFEFHHSPEEDPLSLPDRDGSSALRRGSSLAAMHSFDFASGAFDPEAEDEEEAMQETSMRPGTRSAVRAPRKIATMRNAPPPTHAPLEEGSNPLAAASLGRPAPQERPSLGVSGGRRGASQAPRASADL